MSSLWKNGIPNINAEKFTRPRVELCWWCAMSRKYDSKRRKKWNRRILLCKAIKDLTLTHVKNNKELVWLCVDDIQDYWERTRRCKRRNGRKDMTTQEMINRLRPIINSDFMLASFRDKNYTIGGIANRWRVTIFAVSNMESLEDYITYCNLEKEKI